MTKPFTLTVGPFVGMNDVPALSGQDATRASYLENMYSPQSVVGGDLISRPGFTRAAFGAVARTGTINISNGSGGAGSGIFGTNTLFLTELAVGDLVTVGATSVIVTAIASDTSATASAAANTGASAAYTYNPAGIVGGPIYGVWQHTRTDATYHRLLLVKSTSAALGSFAGGYAFAGTGGTNIRLVEWDPSNALHPFTDRTALSMTGVALATNARIYGQTFANYFLITDQTNRPRKIDFSVPTAPVLSNLTDGNYAFYGPFTVYYGKLMGIDNSDRVTIRWCEENDPDTGWGTGTSDNSWTLRQTSADQLEVLVGTNAALFAFRQNSATSITGAANSDFKSAGTLDDISGTIGTRSPDAAIVVNQAVVFLDQYGRPGRIEPGYGYLPMYDRCIETIRGVPTTVALLRSAWSRFDGALNLVKIGYPAATSSTRDEQMLAFDARTWECMGLHKIPNGAGSTIGHDYAAVLLDGNIFPRFTVASGQTSDLAIYVEQMEATQQASSQDQTAAASTLTVAGIVNPPKTGGDPLIEKRFLRLTVGQRNIGGASGLASLKAAYRGPNGTGYSTAAAMTAPGGSYDGATVKAERGIDVTGRWCQVQITNDTTGNPQTRFTLDTVTLSGVTVDDHPSAR